MRLFTGRYDFFCLLLLREGIHARGVSLLIRCVLLFTIFYGVTGLLALMYRQLGIKTLMVGPRNLIDFSVRLVLSYLRAKRESVID